MPRSFAEHKAVGRFVFVLLSPFKQNCRPEGFRQSIDGPIFLHVPA